MGENFPKRGIQKHGLTDLRTAIGVSSSFCVAGRYLGSECDKYKIVKKTDEKQIDVILVLMVKTCQEMG